MSDSDFLQSALANLDAALHDLPVTGTHLVPDLVLRSYLHDAAENARVVRFLLASEFRDRAFPSARACFEAAQLALLLASDRNYDLAGAKAWVYGHRKDFYQGGQAERAGLLDDLPEHLSAEEFFARQFEEMEETWNRFAPGKGALLQEAKVALDEQKKRRGPDNWAGLNIANALEERVDSMPRPKGMKLPPVKASELLRAAYALLSREAHPHSLRVEARSIRSTASGAITVEFGPDSPAEQADLAEKLTLASLSFAMSAASLHIRMGG